MSEGLGVGRGGARGDAHMDTHAQGTQRHCAGDTETLTGSSAHRFSRTSLHLQEQDQISKRPGAGWEMRSEAQPSCLPCALCRPQTGRAG